MGQPGLVHMAPGQFQEKQQLWSSWGPGSSLPPHPFGNNKSWGQTQERNELHLFMEEQEDHTARGLDMGERNGLLWQHDIPLTPATCPPMTFVRGGQTSHHRCPLPPPTAIPTFDRTCFILEAKWSYWMFLKAEGPGEYGIGKWFSHHSRERGRLPEMIRKTGLRGRHLRLREWSPQRPRAWWRGLVSPTGSHSHL